MKVTPLDLRQAKLRVALRGYDRTEVDALLSEVADDYEQALRETDRLHQELSRLEAVVTEHREHERNLRNTLLTAQRLADEIREHAEQDAKHVLQEAESRAEMVLQKTQTRVSVRARSEAGGLISVLPQAHAPEHCIEVQLPFLQRVLGDFRAWPLLCGEVDAKELAGALSDMIGDGTLVIASSDLSHYLPYDAAVLRDGIANESVPGLDIKRFAEDGDACGKTAVLTLMLGTEGIAVGLASFAGYCAAAAVSRPHEDG